MQALLDQQGLSEVTIANYNTATQLVLSGTKAQIDQAFKQFEQAGIQAIPLNVSGAFHSPHMQAAAHEFAQFMQGFSFQPLQIPVIANATAQPYDDEPVGALLARQMASPVRWNDSVRYLMGQDKTLTVTELTDSPNPVLTAMIDAIQANESPIPPIPKPPVEAEVTDPAARSSAKATKNTATPAKTPKSASKSASKSMPKPKATKAQSAKSNTTAKAASTKSPAKKTPATAQPQAGKAKPAKATKVKKAPVAVSNTSSLPSVTLQPQQLGAASFRQRYGLRYAYLAGAMYKGITSKELVIRMGQAGLLGFLGTAGMTLEQIEADLQVIQQQLSGDQAYGLNLLCHLDQPQIEMDTVALYLRHGVTCVEAAAFMVMTPALVYYRLSGLQRG